MGTQNGHIAPFFESVSLKKFISRFISRKVMSSKTTKILKNGIVLYV